MRGRKAAAVRSLRPSQILYIIVGFAAGVALHSSFMSPSTAPATAAAAPASSSSAAVKGAMPQPPAAPVTVSDITVITNGGKKADLKPFESINYGSNTEGSRRAMESVIGTKKNPYPNIVFPAVVPPRPPPGKRPMLVAVLTHSNDWDKFTQPLLQFLVTVPDAIDVVVVDDGEAADLAAKAVAFDVPVLRGPAKPMDLEAAINTAWTYFQHQPQYEFLTVIQDDVTVANTVFDRLMTCFGALNGTAVVGPMINGVDVGEKTSELDEKSVCWQNSNHRRNRDYYKGRVPRDTHFRLPYTVREHLGWFDRALFRIKAKNVTSAKPVDVMQSFALSFRRNTPPVPGQPNRVVMWGFNLFKHERLAMVDPKVNGREGDRFTAFTTEFADSRFPSHACLNSFMYKDWTESGLTEQWGDNQWSPPGKRNPQRHAPPKNAKWEKG